MSLSAALLHIMDGYHNARGQMFAENPMADFIRREFPDAIRGAAVESDRYVFEGSPGMGNWASVPWGAIFDRIVTETAQEGYYLVYLFRQDGSGVYLSLNQGVTTIRRQYGSDAKQALRVRAADYLARIGKVDSGVITGPIDLRTSKASGLGAYYEQGSICALLYDHAELPSEPVLVSELRLFTDYYFSLVSKESALFDQSQHEDDESGMEWEDLRLLRAHKRVERNQALALKVKKKLGLTCQACGFNFGKFYGEIGNNFIEAHHLTPVAELRGKRVSLDPRHDFAVLCSNCHRMIHRSPYVSDVGAFRISILHHE